MAKEEEANSVDKEDMRGSIAGLYKQVRDGLKLAEGVKVLGEFDDIIVAGMGGSGLPGRILHNVLIDTKTRVTTINDYKLPEWANTKTLVFAVSYSGNTEETISAYQFARKKGCRVVAIASGGKLKEIARKQDVTFIKMPHPFEQFQPRAGVGYMFFAILGVLINSHIVKGMKEDIEKTIKALMDSRIEGQAEEIAEKLVDKLPIIYTSERLAAAGYKWKIAFNENAKTPAFCNVFPEMNHNEMNGYVNHKGPLFVIMLSSDDDPVQVKKRMKITKELIKKQGIPVMELRMKGDSLMTKIFSAILLGDFTAYHLALKYEIDPTPVDMVEHLKKML